MDVVRVPKEQAILGFKTLRPGQLRGVTEFAPAILLAYSLKEYVENEMNTAAKAARRLAVITSQDPSATMAALGGFMTPGSDNRPDKYMMEYGGALIDFLKTGESVSIADNNRPGDTFSPFVRWVIQTFAATVGATYELISGDYQNAKYTGARMARNDMNAGIKVRRARIVRQLCENVRREFMDWAVLTGKLDLPNYFSNPAPYMRAVWLGPGMESIDPLREGRATVEAVDKHLLSPQEAILARQRDPEQVLDELKEWQEMKEERELIDLEAPPSLKTNPAEFAKGTGDGGGKKPKQAQKRQEDERMWRIK